MLMLARFSLGRVLLHLLAMMGDGALRFHAAGILRELPGESLGPARGSRPDPITGNVTEA